MPFSHADVTPEPPTPATLESIAAANSSLTEPASSAPGGEGRLTRGRGSVSGNLAALGRPEGSAQAGNPSITDAAAKLLSGTALVLARPHPESYQYCQIDLLVMQAGQITGTMYCREELWWCR